MFRSETKTRVLVHLITRLRRRGIGPKFKVKMVNDEYVASIQWIEETRGKSSRLFIVIIFLYLYYILDYTFIVFREGLPKTLSYHLIMYTS